MMSTPTARTFPRQAILLALQLAAVATGGALVLLLAARHNLRLDLTPTRSHTLTPITRKVLAQLGEDVTITIFFDGREPARRREMADLMSRYADASDRIRVRMLDLDRSPGAAKHLGVSRYNTGVMDAGRLLPLGVIDEAEITAALMGVIHPDKRVVYFTTGHGERDPTNTDERRGYSELRRTLEANRYTVRQLDGLGSRPVPDDAAVVVVAGPRVALARDALAALRQHVDRGGGVIFLLDPVASGMPPDLVEFLGSYGLTMRNDVVVERNGLLGTDSFMPRVPYLNQSVFPDPPDLPVVLAEAQSVVIDDDAPGIATAYLASTAESSWADSDRDSLDAETPKFSASEDHRGPVPVAALGRASESAAGGVVVIGDADFASNLYLGVMGNEEFFLSILAMLTRRELHGALRPTRPGGALSALSLTARQSLLVFCTTVLVPPALVLLVGLVLARRRRSLAPVHQ